MKKNIFPMMAQVVVLGGVMASSFVSPVAADELAVKTSNGVSYISGGFGMDERARLRNMASGDTI